MKEYMDFLKTKQTAVKESGFEVAENELNGKLFPFQKYCVKRALKSGRFAMFEDCGLGKPCNNWNGPTRFRYILKGLSLSSLLWELSGRLSKRA